MLLQFEVEVNDEIIDIIWNKYIKSGEIFNQYCCSHWLQPVKKHDEYCVAYEFGDDNNIQTIPPVPNVIPANSKWHILNRQTAIDLYKQGILVKGVNWWNERDTTLMDELLQYVLLGDVCYG